MSTEPKITGLYGCDCHPFASWKECEAAYKQKLSPPDKVKNRCTGAEGHVDSNCPERGFVIVKYGGRQCDLHLEHVQELIKLP